MDENENAETTNITYENLRKLFFGMSLLRVESKIDTQNPIHHHHNNNINNNNNENKIKHLFF